MLIKTAKVSSDEVREVEWRSNGLERGEKTAGG
jgi:hypothetical protein